MSNKSILLSYFYGFLTASAISGLYYYQAYYNHYQVVPEYHRCGYRHMENKTTTSPPEGLGELSAEKFRIVKRNEISARPAVIMNTRIFYAHDHSLSGFRFFL